MSQFTEDNFETIDMESVANTALDNIKQDMIVDGEIVRIDSDYAYVNIGAKSDGQIPLTEFVEEPKVGEIFSVKLMSKKLVDGLYLLSKKQADREREWAGFMEYLDSGAKKITGRITSSSKNGKIVSCLGINAFLPSSLTADLRGVSQSEEEYEFVIKTVDAKKHSVILSRKDLLDEMFEERWEAFVGAHHEGDVVQGEVIKLVEFGAFVRVAGIDARVHRKDMSWKKVFDPKAVLKLGEVRDFKILNINMETKKVSLGLKQLVEDPWLDVENRFAPGTEVEGIVVTIASFGAFVEVGNEIEGFLSNSELSWTKKNVNVKDFFSQGDRVNLVVLQVDREKKKISLGYKQLLENPWDTLDTRFPIGSVQQGKIKKIVKFGLFVGLEDGIDGLIHISDITWDDKVGDLSSLFKEGDDVEFKILDIKKDEMRISCGIKQLTKSPWEIIREKYPPKTKVQGTVSSVTDFGVFVKLEDNVEGLVHISEVSKRHIEDIQEHFKVGETVDAVVLDVNVGKKRLSLSIKHYEIISEKEELNNILKQTSPNTVTLGEMINLDFGEKK